MRFNLYILICVYAATAQKNVNVNFFSFDSTATIFEKKFLENIFRFYNKSNKLKYKINYVERKGFKELFTQLDQTTNINENLSISSISVTDERKKKYDFSIIYLPSRHAVLSLKNRTIEKDWHSKGYKVGYIEDTIDETIIKLLQTNSNIIAVAFPDQKSKEEAVLNNKIDIMFNEILKNYSDKRFRVLEDIVRNNYGYAIMYPKGSTLKKQFDPIIDYYIHTNTYFSLLKKWFGNDVASILFKQIK